MVQIIPTVLATSEEQYQKDIARFAAVEALQGGWVHLDFMDNKFVPNHGIRPLVTSKFEIPFKKEAHLMVQYPKEWIDELVKADFKRVFLHLEADGVSDSIDCGKTKGLEVGLVVNYETPLEKLEPFVSKIDSVLLMSVVPGFQGQPFIDGILDKIKDSKSRKWPVRVGVDGAVRDANIKQLVDAGVDYVIVGSFLLQGDVEENLEKLWLKCHSGISADQGHFADEIGI
ncbi:MAG: hypothetical protein M1142_02510 [Patescibacteria group bacterium]|nr:hypothetical protein [Patescibacteria group bacterium]